MPTKQRLLLCRLGFVVLCAVPTLLICGWLATLSASSFSRATKDQWQGELSTRLGLTVEIERLQYPRHDVARLEEVTLRDPETQATLAQAELVEVVVLEDGWSVAVSQLRITTQHLPLLRESLEHRMLRGAGINQPVVTLTPSDITLESAAGNQTLEQVAGSLSRTSEGASLHLTWRLPGQVTAEQPGTITIERNRSTMPPATDYQFDTAGRPVPCLLMADLWPDISRLGRDCKFAGSARLIDSPSGPTGSLSGKLFDVDLDALVTEHFSHQLSGAGQLHIEHAAIDGGKLVGLRGTLQARDGAISPSLLVALQEHLELELMLDPQLLDANRAEPFGRLGIGFELDGQSLRLIGISDAARDGVLLSSASGPVLVAPPQHATPAVNLLRALLPDNQFQVPATRQTGALIGLFPVPDRITSRTASLPAHTPTRLRSSGPADAAPVLRQPGLR